MNEFKEAHFQVKDRFDEITVGDEAEILHIITAKDLDTFAILTGDDNPLHMDDAYAASTALKKRVVHGMLTASFISTIIGTKLPGKGALWYEQQLRFLAPARIGEKIRIKAKVKHKSNAQRILVIATDVFGNEGRKLIEGEAKVKVLKPEEKQNSEAVTKEKGAVIITGASGGIGSAIALKLSSLGYPIVVNYSKNVSKAESVVSHIKNNDGQAIAFQADVVDADAVKSMVDSAVREYGFIEGIVNNAAPPVDALDFANLSWSSIQTNFDVQIKGAFNLSQAILPYVLEKQKGVIVNICSIVADNIPPVKWMPYTIAKTALAAFSRCLAVELGHKGIRVNSVSPGLTQTDFIADLPEKAKMIAKMQTPLRKLGVPEDVAGVVAFLFSDGARHITGENIRVCGGLIMK
jgi:3-oxoacyl-[acyl-carrier protein] reductase